MNTMSPSSRANNNVKRRYRASLDRPLTSNANRSKIVTIEELCFPFQPSINQSQVINPIQKKNSSESSYQSKMHSYQHSQKQLSKQKKWQQQRIQSDSEPQALGIQSMPLQNNFNHQQPYSKYHYIKVIQTPENTSKKEWINAGIEERMNLFSEKQQVQVILSKIINQNKQQRQIPIKAFEAMNNPKKLEKEAKEQISATKINHTQNAVKNNQNPKNPLQNYTSYYNLNINGNYMLKGVPQVSQVQKLFQNLFFPRQFVKLNSSARNIQSCDSNKREQKEKQSNQSFDSNIFHHLGQGESENQLIFQNIKMNTEADDTENMFDDAQVIDTKKEEKNEMSSLRGQYHSSNSSSSQNPQKVQEKKYIRKSNYITFEQQRLKKKLSSLSEKKKLNIQEGTKKLDQENNNKIQNANFQSCQIATSNSHLEKEMEPFQSNTLSLFNIHSSNNNENAAVVENNSIKNSNSMFYSSDSNVINVADSNLNKLSDNSVYSKIAKSNKIKKIYSRNKSECDAEKLSKLDQILDKCTNKTYQDPEGDLKRAIPSTPKCFTVQSRPQTASYKMKENIVDEKQSIKNQQVEDSSGSEAEEPDIDSDEENEQSQDDEPIQIQQYVSKAQKQDAIVFGSHAIYGINEYSKPKLLQSVYEKRPATIFFQYPSQCEGIVRDESRAIPLTDLEEKRFDLRFKVTTVSLNRCIGHAFQCAGIRETEEDDWNIGWGIGSEMKVKKMNKFQKNNHFPQWWNMGRKDCLWKNLSKIKRKFPNEYDFIPKTYILQHQSDWEQFLNKRVEAEKGRLWIMKPSNQSQGKNIKMISKRTRVQRKQEYIICEYVANPHLINGLKYDLRIYVLVSSYDPLRVYIFKDGLARFATEKYSTSAKELSKRYVHLTNYSLNKHNPNFKQNEDTTREDVGSKWSLQALFKKYAELEINTDLLWDRIKDIVIKTCIAAEPYMTDQYVKCENHRTNCFELYGFDILVDENLKPWLLEVNVRPSLSAASPLDRRIKHTLVCDVFNLVGIVPFDKRKFEEDQKKKIPGVSDQKRGQFSKFINDLSDLTEYNCLNKLSPEDWVVLFEMDEENHRRGHFERIFPMKEQIDHYLQFFEYPRYNISLVKAWLKSSCNILEKILKKVSNQIV